MIKIKDYEFDTGVVPEIFFDVIARIVPGITILFVFWLNQIKFIDPTKFLDSISSEIPTDVTAFKVLVIIFGGYVLGLLLHQLWIFGCDLTPFFKKEITNQEIYILRKNHPSLASTLLKFQAEITLSEVMMSGLSLIIIFSMFNKLIPESLNFLTAPTMEFTVFYVIVVLLFLLLRKNLEQLSIASRDELKKQAIICIDISGYWPHGMTVNQVYSDNTNYPHGTLTQDQLSQAINGELLIANLNTNHLETLIKFARIQDSSATYQNILKPL